MTTDNLTPADRRRTMQAVKGRGTKPERRLFSMLAGMGIRGWRKNASDVVGKPDIVFPNERLAVFVDGCFWHGCPQCQRPLPQANREYWQSKIERNIQRAAVANQQLAAAGWIVIRIWEHELRDRAAWEAVKERIRQALGGHKQ